MSARRRSALIVAGALASATVACAAPALAQLPILTTTTTTSSTTTTTTAASTTTTTDGGGSGTTTTTDSEATTTTTTSGTTTTIATTTTTSNGSLSINVPADADLAAASIDDSSISGSLGPVQVTDSRGSLAGGWTAKVAASAFTTGGGSAEETIPAASVFYWSGPATATSGAGTFTPGQLTRLLAVGLDGQRTAFSCASLGSCSATWQPGIEIRFPSSIAAGEYVGSISHSVA